MKSHCMLLLTQLFWACTLVSPGNTFNDRKPSEDKTEGSCPNSKMPQPARDLLLKLHNDVRLNVALGQQPNKEGFLGPAKNMYKLSWDCKYEEILQKAVEQCSNVVLDELPTQNTIQAHSGDYSNLNGILDQMKRSFRVFIHAPKRFGATNIYPENPRFFQLSNVLFDKTTKMGCAYKVCGHYFFLNCAYNNAVQQTHRMWENGPACQKNEDCTTYEGSACDGGLCIQGKSTEARVGGPNKMCPELKYEVNDEIRQLFLDTHNKRRSQLAKGLARDPKEKSGFAPKARFMKKMVWDCGLEAIARNNAKTCHFKHTPMEVLKGTGEALWSGPSGSYDKMIAAQTAPNDWWSELKRNGMGPSERQKYTGKNKPYQTIGHFTQMAWWSNYKVGCSVKWCDGWTYGVCNYLPGGNVSGRPVYVAGNPCRRDSDCDCKGCKCSVEEALCIMPK